MQLDFAGRNIEVTPALKEFATEKLSSLEKRDNRITQVHVTFHIENTTQKAEATVHTSGIELHAQAESEDMYKSIELLADKLIAQVTKHKEKMTEHR